MKRVETQNAWFCLFSAENFHNNQIDGGEWKRNNVKSNCLNQIYQNGKQILKNIAIAKLIEFVIFRKFGFNCILSLFFLFLFWVFCQFLSIFVEMKMNRIELNGNKTTNEDLVQIAIYTCFGMKKVCLLGVCVWVGPIPLLSINHIRKSHETLHANSICNSNRKSNIGNKMDIIKKIMKCNKL